MADLSKYSTEELKAMLASAKKPEAQPDIQPETQVQAAPDVQQKPDIKSIPTEELRSMLKVAKDKPLEAFQVGVEQGATFGARPVLAGAGAAIGQAAGVFSGTEGMGLAERLKASVNAAKSGFSQGRQEAIDEQARLAESNPVANTVGNIGGSLLSTPFVAAKGLSGALKLGGISAAGRSAGEANSLEDVVKIAGTDMVGSLAGYRLGNNLGALGKGFSQGLNIEGSNAANAVGNAIGKAARITLDAPGKAAIKVASGMTGISEQDILTYASKSKEIQSMLKRAGGSIPEAADRIRENIQRGIQNTKTRLNRQIEEGLTSSSKTANIDLGTVTKSLDDSLARLDPRVNSAEIEEINGIKNLIDKFRDPTTDAQLTGPSKPFVNVSDLNKIKNILQEKAKSTYVKDGQIFQTSTQSKMAANKAAFEANKILGVLAPQIRDANLQLSQLHRIDDKIARNLITSGKPEAALLAAGAGENLRNNLSLKRLSKITGNDFVGEAQKLSAARTFENPSILPQGSTGKSTGRTVVAAGLAGLLGGPVAAVVAGAATSPIALKLAINTGKIPVEVIKKITNTSGEITEAVLKKAFDSLQTGEGQKYLIRAINSVDGNLVRTDNK